MTLNKITAAAIAGLLTVGFTAPIVAQDMMHGADAIAKRQELMKSNGGTLKNSGADPVAAADTLIANFEELKDLWPEDSMEGKTKALPTVWSDSEGFEVAMNNALSAAQALKVAAEGGDAAEIGAAIKATGATCGACHQSYKAN